MRCLGLPSAVAALLTLFVDTQVAGLRIATSLQWIEHTPQEWAIKNYYKGDSAATLVSGGVQNLAGGGGGNIDLAANAETQGLLTYARQKDIRLIYVICEVAYRIVASRKTGVSTLADLKGKRIGTFPGTSAAYFVSKLLATAGLQDGDYRVVSGNVCMKAPCAAGTFPAMLASGQIDAFGIWEPAVELAAEALGDDAVLFQNATVYQEIYSLYTTQAKLDAAATRRDILAYVRALNQTLDVFTNHPDQVYATVASLVGMDIDVVKAVWPVHTWPGRWRSDMLEFLTQEDQWLAKQNRRQAATSAELQTFLDSTILDEL